MPVVQTLQSGPVAISAMAVSFAIKTVLLQGQLSGIDASNPLNTISYQLQASYDGGKTYRTVAASTWQGGLDRQGNPCPPACSWSPSKAPTHVQAVFNLAQPLLFGGAIVLS